MAAVRWACFRRRRPGESSPEAGQSVGAAEPVAAVTEQGQGLLVAGGRGRIVCGLLLHGAGALAWVPGPATSALLQPGAGAPGLVSRRFAVVGGAVQGPGWLSDV
jgi:hypothetical protein